MVAVEVSLNTKCGPIPEFLLDICLCRLWLKSERVSAEVNALRPAACPRDMKSFPEASQRIGGIHVVRMPLARLKSPHLHDSSSGANWLWTSLSALLQS